MSKKNKTPNKAFGFNHLNSHTWAWDGEKWYCERWSPHEVQLLCNRLVWETITHPFPHNIFTPYNRLDLYELATKAERYEPTDHFMRHWLDEMIEWAGYAIWNYHWKTVMEIEHGNTKAGRLADAQADAAHKTFISHFA